MNKENSPKSLTRKELYDLVWTKPIMEIAKDYGLSDRGLGKFCTKHNIPVPPRGHWRKVECGQKISKPKLSSMKNNDEDIILEPRKSDNINSLPEDLKLQIKNEKLPENKIIVETPVKNWHPLIKEWNRLDKLNKSKVDTKARRILNTLVLALEDRGFIIEQDDKYNRMIKVGTDEDKLTIYLDRYKRIFKRELTPEDGWKWKWRSEGQGYTFDEEQTNFLAIYIKDSRYYDNTKRFTETEDTPIEEMLNKVIAYIRRKLWSEKKKRLEREEWHRQYEIRRLAEEEKRELIRIENEKREKLIIDSKKWREAEDIRAYVLATQKAFKDGGLDKSLIELNEWSKWALNYANQIDPIIE